MLFCYDDNSFCDNMNVINVILLDNLYIMLVSSFLNLIKLEKKYLSPAKNQLLFILFLHSNFIYISIT